MKKNGFTLIEILIVIAILGIIGTVMIGLLNPIDQIRKSNDAKRKVALEQIQRALELYYQDRGQYPPSSSNFKIFVNPTTYNWGSAWTPYINVLPADPNPTKTFIYYSPAASNGQTYYLYANLERGAKDPQACNGGSACTSITSGGAGAPTATACGATCNYGISSPNVSP